MSIDKTSDYTTREGAIAHFDYGTGVNAKHYMGQYLIGTSRFAVTSPCGCKNFFVESDQTGLIVADGSLDCKVFPRCGKSEAIVRAIAQSLVDECAFTPEESA